MIRANRLASEAARIPGESEPGFYQLEPDGELVTPAPLAPTSRI